MRFTTTKDVKRLFVSPNSSLLDALDVIDRGGCKTAIVVDENGKLLGVIADPDIRRALLDGKDLQQSVHAVMNRNPITLKQGVTGQEARQALYRYKRDVLPVIDAIGHVLDAAILVDNLGQTKRENAVVLMAGGLGARLLPLTKELPKPMLKVGSKPLLETLLDNFIAAGFSKFYISVNYLQDAIEAHFDDGSKWGVEIAYLREEEALGTCGALSLIDRDAVRHPFIMMNCDILTKVDFESLLKHHENSDAAATMCISQHEVSIPFGVVEHEDFRLKKIVEKPSLSYFVNAGVYVFSPEVLGLLKVGEAFDVPQLITRVDDRFGEVSLFPIREYWLDVGNHQALEKARQDYPLHFDKE